jgi:hypothetical protein
VSKTLLEFGRNPRWLGGQIAASLLLHTCNQVLLQHLHLHCLVAGGALGANGQWISPRGGFLFPVQALSAVFRGKFLDGLGTLLAKAKLKLAGSTAALAQPSAQRRFLAILRQHDWVVYAKRTLAGPQAALDYLGRYTYKTAISNHRLLSLDLQGDVRFSWRDRAHGNRRRIMQLPAAQFLDRFVLHVLPPGLVRIRHIGLLANRHKHQQLAQARTALAAPAPAPAPKESAQQLCLRVLGIDIERCTACSVGHLRVVAQIPATHAPLRGARTMTTRSTPSVSTAHRCARGTSASRSLQLTLASPSAIVAAIATALRCPDAKRLPAQRSARSHCAPAPAPASARFNPHTLAP